MSEKKQWQINKQEYVKNFKKEHYKRFSADLPKEETDEIDAFLKEKGMSRANFVRFAFKYSQILFEKLEEDGENEKGKEEQ